MPTATIRAYAKLNLHLDVLGRRADGYHRLETIFQTIGLHDEIILERDPTGQGISLTCDQLGVPADATNLVWRAAAAFIAGREAQAGGLALHLRKGVPHGAGLGGGSSDAAATLRLLAHLLPGWHDASSLHLLAAKLGSDVPFFLVGGTALGEERGEVLTPLADAPPMPVTVLMPAAHLLTPAVFAALTTEERGPRAGRGVAWWRQQMTAEMWPQILHNRLTAAAVRLCPAVGTLLAHLHGQGVPCLMSGSGAACFALAACTPPSGVSAWPTTFISRTEALASPCSKAR
ncbi:MAG: 4-(cytidine 5'-diphospho)-2-C-methyl-D-erythritol kinase [Planctomycetes bacterium]|jgi:4-diphosphocytidyl-2-C-methyl-D-erythritol kinase|nr:4-(cytidine 5'-diphospho)-2-C-methyl-D-erythritol kinase [Planctomycetota bacterium]